MTKIAPEGDKYHMQLIFFNEDQLHIILFCKGVALKSNIIEVLDFTLRGIFDFLLLVFANLHIFKPSAFTVGLWYF